MIDKDLQQAKDKMDELDNTIKSVNGKESLYQKIFNVMNAIGYLEKDIKVQFNNTNYKALSEEKVTSAVRKELLKNRLVILPMEIIHNYETVVKAEYNGKKQLERFSKIDAKYKIIDIDTGEFEVIMSAGLGVDSQEKGVGKAMTYSYKYALLKAFAIPSGEDPDYISSEELDSKGNNLPKAKQNTQMPVNPQNKPQPQQLSNYDAEINKYLSAATPQQRVTIEKWMKGNPSESAKKAYIEGYLSNNINLSNNQNDSVNNNNSSNTDDDIPF
jgi:hypothetical protein